MRNLDVRVIIDDSGFTYKQIAKQMGISRGWLSALMRYDLTPYNRDRIMNAVNALEKQENHEKAEKSLSLD